MIWKQKPKEKTKNHFPHCSCFTFKPTSLEESWSFSVRFCLQHQLQSVIHFLDDFLYTLTSHRTKLLGTDAVSTLAKLRRTHRGLWEVMLSREVCCSCIRPCVSLLNHKAVMLLSPSDQLQIPLSISPWNLFTGLVERPPWWVIFKENSDYFFCFCLFLFCQFIPSDKPRFLLVNVLYLLVFLVF